MHEIVIKLQTLDLRGVGLFLKNQPLSDSTAYGMYRIKANHFKVLVWKHKTARPHDRTKTLR